MKEYRFGMLIPTDSKLYYFSQVLSFEKSSNDFSHLEKAMRQKAKNPKNYQFSTSDSFDTPKECEKESLRKKDELNVNGYQVKMIEV